jgi:MscS family membrane protein
MAHRLTMTFQLCASALLMMCISFSTVQAQGSGEAAEGKGAPTSSVAKLSNTGKLPLQPVDTSSPRATLQSFLRLTREAENAILAHQKNQSRANFERITQLGDQFAQLLDFSLLRGGSRQVVRARTVSILMDIIGRLDLPPIESVPGADAFADDEPSTTWRIPNTPVTIARIEQGPREMEFLFSARTVTRARAQYERIKHLPLRSSIGIESWQLEALQLHGPAIPARLVAGLPSSLKQPWLGTPIWKILTVVIMGSVAVIFLVVCYRMTRPRATDHKTIAGLRRLLTPSAIILVVLTMRLLIADQVIVYGFFAQKVEATLTVVIYLAAGWVFWRVVLELVEWIILSPKIPDESLDADLLRLAARVIGFVGGLLILAYGANELGIPVLGVVAGLGVGGLAVALAIRPTLENLIGGIVLYADRPVSVGDFCSFGTNEGTVERIGVRSTQIRALDRTLISIPNATFADMEIVNWAKCDQMQILATIGLRYETEPDQLRYVLAKLREMFLAHPRIDKDTVRIRFVGYGASSLDVEIRVYALTRDRNDLFAIREDVFLRVNEIVAESGTGFAFPSQTLYLGRDEGLDKERSDAAKQHVQSWRRTGQLPFPNTARTQREQIADTLDYPPRGSPEAHNPKSPAAEETEPLSTEPESKSP